MWVRGGVSGAVGGLAALARHVEVMEGAAEGEDGGGDAVADPHALAEGTVALPVLPA